MVQQAATVRQCSCRRDSSGPRPRCKLCAAKAGAAKSPASPACENSRLHESTGALLDSGSRIDPTEQWGPWTQRSGDGSSGREDRRERPRHGLAHLASAFSSSFVQTLAPRARAQAEGDAMVVPTPEVMRAPAALPGVRMTVKPQFAQSHFARSTDAHADKGEGAQEAEGAAKPPVQRIGGIREQLMCGAFAGVVSRTAIAPIDLVRTHLISSHGMEGASKTAMGVLQSIVKRDGWPGLFRGNGINCLRVAPNKAIELCTFQMLKHTFSALGHPLQSVAAPLSGGAAGMAGTIATYPLEVMRTRISIQPDRYSGLIQTFTRMVREEGIGSLYRGLPISLLGVFPYSATSYFVYDALRGMYRRVTGREKVPSEATLMFGAVAASVSSAVTFPLEVARRRLQLGAVAGTVPKSGLAVIRHICETEGWKAVYRGLGTTWLKLIPAAGISFVCYEAARYALKVDDASVAAAAAARAAAHGKVADASNAGRPGAEPAARPQQAPRETAPGALMPVLGLQALPQRKAAPARAAQVQLTGSKSSSRGRRGVDLGAVHDSGAEAEPALGLLETGGHGASLARASAQLQGRPVLSSSPSMDFLPLPTPLSTDAALQAMEEEAAS